MWRNIYLKIVSRSITTEICCYYVSSLILIQTITLSSSMVLPKTDRTSPKALLSQYLEQRSNARCVDDNLLCPSNKSSLDYWYMVLPRNNLRVVLISNKFSTKSGVSLTVSTGSFDNPDNFLGLAHLCEHMLFLGTRKYPDNDLSEYVLNNGGKSNARTYFHYTNYYYIIDSSKFERSLDMFSQFFISPLFEDSYLQRELNIVHQEYCHVKNENSRRKLQLLRYVSNRNHPFHRFDNGNLDSLNKSGLRDELMRFFHERYSSDMMSLVVFDNRSISEMIEVVDRYFSSIPNKNFEPLGHGSDLPFSGHMGRVIIYEHKSSSDILSFYWQTPGLEQFSRYAIRKFISRYLKHQGEGSIFRYLHKHNLASRLITDATLETDSFNLFSFTIKLTKQGMEDVSRVSKIVFEFMEILKSISEDRFNQLWDDFITVSQLLYDQRGTVSIFNLIRAISNSMRVNKRPMDILSNPKVYTKDFRMIKSVLSFFTPANCLIVLGTTRALVSPVIKNKEAFLEVREDVASSGIHFPPLPELDMIEPYYSILFTIYKIPSVLLEYWSSTAGNGELHLPAPNPFIFHVHSLIDSEEMMEEPVVVLGHPSRSEQMWVMPSVYKDYQSSLMCELLNADGIRTAQYLAMSLIYLALVRYKLSSTMYTASELDYKFTVAESSGGVLFKIEGYSDPNVFINFMNISLRALINENDQLRDPVVFRQVLENEMQAIRDNLVNYNTYQYAAVFLESVVLNRPRWTHHVLLDSMTGLDLDTVLQYGQSKLMNNLNLVCLMFGNIEVDDSIDYFLQVKKIFQYRMYLYPIAKGYSYSIVKLNQGVEYGLVMPNINPMDSNSVIVMQFQSGNVCHLIGKLCSLPSLQRYINLMILDYIMENECQRQLRVREGLGYIVTCQSIQNGNIGLFKLVVQSDTFTPQHVITSINSFLEGVFNNIIMADNFKGSFKEALNPLRGRIFSNSANSLESFVWLQIKTGNLNFNFKKQVLMAINTVDEKLFGKFYFENILDANRRRKLTIVTHGPGKEVKLDVDCHIIFNRIAQTENTLDSSCR